MNYIVYKTTNKINGKIYIGVHRTNPDIFDGYIGCGMTSINSQRNVLKGFPLAVRKYGYENFVRETLFVYPDTEEGKKMAYNKESEIVNIDFIKDKNTYNLVRGGNIPPAYLFEKQIAQYTLEGMFIRTWDSIKEAEETLGLNSISANLTGKSKYCGNFQWKYFTTTDNIAPVQIKEKSIYQFDLQGNLIKCWKSASLASLEFKNPNSARVAINNVCRNITRQAFGYYWSYKCQFNYIPYDKFTAVASYNDEGKFLLSFSSIKDAAAYYEIKNPTNISHCIAGKQKRCGKVRWRYFFGNTNDISPI